MAKIFLALFFSIVAAHSQEIIPGLIPRFYSLEAATDLSISPEIAHEQALAGADISLLAPDESSNIWKNEAKEIPQLDLLEGKRNVRFIKELPSRSGQIRFTVVTDDQRELIVVLSKKVHNFLLRRNILAKLGYETQPMSWASNLNLTFESTIDRDLFIEEMKDKLLAGTERWIVKQDGLEMMLQDALVLAPEADIYNLALGVMNSEIHRGRRLLRAPYVALAMLDTPESINLMPWQAGRIVLNNLKLYHTQDLDTGYGTSWEDARWIGRRLFKLSRLDLEEIVSKSYYPDAVEKLLIEKVVSRRNDLVKLLSLDKEFVALKFNPDVTLGADLIKGEVVKEFFPGYSSRFSYGDPESPFSSSELGWFALSRVQSQLINTGISKLNQLLGTDDKKLYSKKLMDIVSDEGPFFSTQAVFIPSFHGSVILSRDIVTGAYMGTSNKVQIVDNFGFSLDAGVMGGVEGMPFPIKINGKAGLAFQRLFSHVKPIQTLKKSMKEPYKNLVVSLLLKKLAHKIDDLSTVSGDSQQAMIVEITNELKDSLAIGESFIITDSLVPQIGGEGQLSISQFFTLDPNLLKLYAGFQTQRMMLSRFHLHRADENTFHIYKDQGKNIRMMFTIKLKTYVPILGFSARWSHIKAETLFYPVSLNPRTVSVEVLKALRESLLSLKDKSLSEVVKPHHIEQVSREAGNTMNILFFKRNKVGSEQTIKISHADGGEDKMIYRRYDALTSGVDFESYTTEALNDIIGNVLKSDISLSSIPTINPGFTLGGKARNKIYSSEFDGKRLTTSYVRMFNGWKVKPKRLNRLMKIINNEMGQDFFSPLSYGTTDSILLYQIQVNIMLAHEAFARLCNIPVNHLAQILYKHRRIEFQTNEELMNLAQRLKNEIHDARKLFSSDPDQGMKKYHLWLKDFQEYITAKGLETIVGKENISYQGRVDGFRQGDENGDSPILSHVFGELPVSLHTTPSQQVMQSIGIIEGELLLNWMMERAI